MILTRESDKNIGGQQNNHAQCIGDGILVVVQEGASSQSTLVGFVRDVQGRYHIIIPVNLVFRDQFHADPEFSTKEYMTYAIVNLISSTF